MPNYRIGRQYDNNKQYQNAADSYIKAIQIYPEFETAYFYLSIDYYHLKKFQNESNVLIKLINIHPTGEYYNRLGVAYADENNYQQAVTMYNKATSLDNTQETYYSNLGIAYHQLHDIGNEIWAYQQTITINPNDAYMYNKLGLAYDADKQYQKAYQAYARATQLKPSSPTYHYNVACMKSIFKDYQDAILELQKALKFNPNIANYQNFLGNLYINARQYKSAVPCYQNAIQLDNSKPIYFGNLGYAYHLLKNYSQSNQLYRQALQLDSSHHQYYIRMAENYKHMNNPQVSIETYQQSLLHDKNNFNKAYDNNQLGILFEGININKALNYYQKADNLNPNPVYLNNLAYCYLKTRQYNQSLKIIKQSLDMDKKHQNDSRAYAIQMNDYYYLHQYSAQRQTISILMKRYPQDSRFQNEMGWSYFIEGKYQDAITWFKKAIQIKGAPVYYINLAKAQKELGNYSKAINASKEAIFLDPQSTRGHRELASIKSIKNTIHTSNTLNNLVGLTSVKKQLRKYINRFIVNKARTGKKNHGEIHLVFEGNPGTGKTTVARLFSELLFQKGVTQKKNYKEINATHLESTLQGGSAKRVNRAIKAAMGGVLFIDEAYSLGKKESSMESALNTLITGIETYKNQIVVILAGYTDRMNNFINNANPGLKSRFPNIIKFPNYSNDECWQILKNFLKKNHFNVDNQQHAPQILEKKFKGYIQQQREQDPKHFANARTVRNVFDSLNGNFSDRVAQQYRGHLEELGKNGQLNTIRLSDVQHTFNHHIDKNLIKHNYLKDLDSLIGLNTVKTQIRSYINQVKGEKRLYDKNVHGEIHLVFMGNPGTGKTTVAKLFGKILYQYGVTSNDNYVELNATSLSSKWQGESSQKAKNALRQSMGGVLFIDEAYALGSKESSTQQAVDTLLTGIENHKKDIVVILAGYTDKMKNLLNNVNPGLKSRFSKIIQFPDYSNHECQQIFALDAKKDNLQISQKNNTKQILNDDLDKYISVEKGRNPKNFGNARTVRNIFSDVKGNVLNRVAQIPKAKFDQLKAEGKSNVIELSDVQKSFKNYTVKDKAKQHDYMKDLNDLIGLKPIKKQLASYINQVKANQRIYGKKQNGHSRIHLVFEGSPGTGKTTVAKLLCKIFFQKGITQSDNYKYLNATHLTSSLQGGSVKKIESAVREALGGVLFIDEAYSLGGKESSMQEAVDTLLTDVENHQSDLVVILAGYTKKMENMINYVNPGFKSRFPTVVKFPDYTPQECQQIMQLYIKKADLTIDNKDTEQLLNSDVTKFIKIKKTTNQDNFANARTVRNAFDVLISAFKSRIAELPSQQIPILKKNNKLKQIKASDVKNAFMTFGISNKNRQKAYGDNHALNKLNKMIGLSGVKNKLQSYINTNKVKRLMHDNSPIGIHLVFEGGPGTGKTTVARLFAKALYENHIVPSSRFKEVEAEDLMGSYEGQTKDKVKKIINSALGGVLFVDEAYGLGEKPGQSDSFKEDAVTEFIAEVDNHRNDLAVILAGYTDKMEYFLHHSNAGFNSRFSTRIIFPNYSNQDCLKILDLMLKNKGAQLANNDTKRALIQSLNATITRAKEIEKSSFGNGRFIRQIAKQILQTKDNRLGQLPYNQLFSISKYNPKEMKTIKANDINKAFQNLNH